jgi:hypothetical protein
MSWSELPTNLRTVLGAALLLVIGVAVASFTLSFIALREVAANQVTGWGRNAWIFPLCVDAALLASEVVLVGVSMVKGVNRAVPFTFMVLFGALTVWFNIERVPAQWRLVTGVPPVAGIFMTMLIAFLVKVLALALGKPMVYDTPPPQTASLGLPQTTVVRLPDGSYGLPGSPVPGHGPASYGPQALYGQTPTWAPSQIQQTGPSAELPNSAGGNGDLAEVTKRRQVEAHLAELTPDQLQRLAGLGPKAAARELTPTLNSQGLQVSERYVQQILDEFLAARRGSGRTTARKPKR